jgi:hypothetical protein
LIPQTELIVSASKTKQRFWVTFLLNDLVEGNTFAPGIIHLTIIPWFVADVPEQDIIESFRKFFIGFKQLDIRVGPQVNFGPQNDVSVNLLNPTPQLTEIHNTALKWFEQIDARWAVKNPYVGKEFKPHIRRRPGIQIKENDILHLKSLSLVKANRQENNIRIIAAKVGTLNG